MNWTTLAGHLGNDAEERFTPSGKKVITFRIACNTKRGGKDETTWWRVTIWGDRFDKIVPYLKKGSALIVSGEMSKPTLYVDRDGNQQIGLELTAESIRFNPFGKSNSGEGQQESSFSGSSVGGGNRSMAYGGATQSSAVGSAAVAEMNDDEIPF